MCVLFALFQRAQFGPRKEERQIQDSGERPADILIPGWDGGKALCIDVTVVSPFVHGAVGENALTTSERAENLKVRKYRARCEENGTLFEPFVLETTGGWGKCTEGHREAAGSGSGGGKQNRHADGR